MPQPQVLAELREREPIFHRPGLGTSRADFEASTAADYWEVGASGRIHERESVWAVLAVRYADPQPEEWDLDEFACREAGPGTYLVTYRLRFAGRLTRRLTVWQRTDAGWRALYHQGTVVEGG